MTNSAGNLPRAVSGPGIAWSRPEHEACQPSSRLLGQTRERTRIFFTDARARGKRMRVKKGEISGKKTLDRGHVCPPRYQSWLAEGRLDSPQIALISLVLDHVREKPTIRLAAKYSRSVPFR